MVDTETRSSGQMHRTRFPIKSTEIQDPEGQATFTLQHAQQRFGVAALIRGWHREQRRDVQ